MKNILFISIITSLFIGCGSSGSGKNDNNQENNTTKSDIVLKKGDSLVCTKATKFSVEPTENPAVNFVKDIETGDVTIELKKDSKGFVTVVGCTKR